VNPITEDLALLGRHVLVASGPTRAPIDAVRYIGNRSTGRLGSAIGTELLRRGARVTFVYGTGSRVPVPTVENLVLDEIETIDEAETRIFRHLVEQEIFAVIMALAGLDYRPRETVAGKIASDLEERTLTLVKCQKIIDRVKIVCPSSLLVGFKLEVQVSEEDLFLRAEELAKRARCDLVVANRADEISQEGHRAWFVYPEGVGRRVRGPFETPEEIACALADELIRVGPGGPGGCP